MAKPLQSVKQFAFLGVFGVYQLHLPAISGFYGDFPDG